MAAAVVAAHNHVLRRWLRCESPDPAREVDYAMRLLIGLFAASARPGAADGTTIVAFRTSWDLSALIPALQRLADESPAP
jgi:hypothetical protein